MENQPKKNNLKSKIFLKMCSPPGPEYSNTDFHDCIFFGFLPKVMICSDYSDSEQSM